MRKVADERVRVLLMALHPALNNEPLPPIASRTIFQFNLTA
jgi:hypothetical protein